MSVISAQAIHISFHAFPSITMFSFYSKMLPAPILMRIIRELVMVHGLSIKQIIRELHGSGLEQADVLTAFEVIFDLRQNMRCSFRARDVRCLLMKGLSPSEIASRFRTGEEEIRHHMQRLSSNDID
jgi:hypothetical protein